MSNTRTVKSSVAARAGGSARAQFARDVISLLWPGSDVLVGGSGSGSGGALSYVAVPSWDRARLVLPTQPEFAAASFRDYKLSATRRERIVLGVAAWAMARGLSRLWPARVSIKVDPSPDADDLRGHLERILRRQVHFTMQIGPARANRKAVVQLIDGDGHTFAFAKVGINVLTRALVTREAEALTTVRDLGIESFDVPEVLHHGTWNGAAVLVLKALPRAEGRRISRARLTQAMVELSMAEGVVRHPVAESPYVCFLMDRLASLPNGDGLAFGDVVRRLTGTDPALDLPLGGWHGDWTSWNMAATSQGLLVWDWERYQKGIPLGYDAVHCFLHDSIVCDGTDPVIALDRMLSNSRGLLKPFGLSPRRSTLVALLYLAELSARYLGDGQAQAGARLGRVHEWILPTLVTATDAFIQEAR